MEQKHESQPIYATIYNKIRNSIFSGILQPGAMLPSENQLCLEYSVSRETVRKSLQLLSKEGLIHSRAKVGYFVSAPNCQDIVLHMGHIGSYTTQYCDIHGIMPNAEQCARLQVPQTRQVIEISQITKASDGQVLAYEIKYIPYERAYPSVEGEIRFASLPDIAFSKLDSYQHYIEVDIRPVCADEKLSKIFSCPVGEAMLLITRTSLRQDNVPVAYSECYCCKELGTLRGYAGHVQNGRSFHL